MKNFFSSLLLKRGLDSVLADAMDAFEIIEGKLDYVFNNILHTETKHQIEQLKKLLVYSNYYLKFEYKKNLSYDSVCSDHCVSFALSSTNICAHEHVRNCLSCINLDQLLDTIENHFKSLSLFCKFLYIFIFVLSILIFF